MLVSPKLEVRFSILRLLSLMKLTFSVSDQIISGVTTVLTTPILNGESKWTRASHTRSEESLGLEVQKITGTFQACPPKKSSVVKVVATRE